MTELLSLYDYLGRAAGPQLGASVAEYAKKKKATISIRHVSNPKYTGTVNLYEQAFLQDYFGDSSQQAIIEADKKSYEEKKKRFKK